MENLIEKPSCTRSDQNGLWPPPSSSWCMMASKSCTVATNQGHIKGGAVPRCNISPPCHDLSLSGGSAQPFFLQIKCRCQDWCQDWWGRCFQRFVARAMGSKGSKNQPPPVHGLWPPWPSRSSDHTVTILVTLNITLVCNCDTSVSKTWPNSI